MTDQVNRTALVYAECANGKLRRVALEALGAARRLAGDGGEVHAVLAGGGPAAALAEAAAELAARGARVVHVVDDPALARFAPEAFAAAIGAAVAAVRPSVHCARPHRGGARARAPRGRRAAWAATSRTLPPSMVTDGGSDRDLYPPALRRQGVRAAALLAWRTVDRHGTPE